MRQMPLLLTCFLAALLVAPGADARPPRGEKKAKAPPYRVTTWGALQGTCRVSHAIQPLTIRYKCVRKEPKRGAALNAIHNPKTLTLDGCLVYLKSVESGKDWPARMSNQDRSHTLEMHRTDYVPRVSWVREKTQLRVRAVHAEDDFNFHMYFNSRANTVANFFVDKSAPEVAPATAFVKRPGLYLLCDDCRDAMHGFLHVSSHPYVFGPTTINGRYQLPDVPPGIYTLVCWHEGLGMREIVLNRGVERTELRYEFDPPITLQKQITVEPGKTLTVDWTFDVPNSLRATRTADTK